MIVAVSERCNRNNFRTNRKTTIIKPVEKNRQKTTKQQTKEIVQDLDMASKKKPKERNESLSIVLLSGPIISKEKLDNTQENSKCRLYVDKNGTINQIKRMKQTITKLIQQLS